MIEIVYIIQVRLLIFIGKGLGWPQESGGKGRTFNCRMLLKPAGKSVQTNVIKRGKIKSRG